MKILILLLLILTLTACGGVTPVGDPNVSIPQTLEQIENAQSIRIVERFSLGRTRFRVFADGEEVGEIIGRIVRFNSNETLTFTNVDGHVVKTMQGTWTIRSRNNNWRFYNHEDVETLRKRANPTLFLDTYDLFSGDNQIGQVRQIFSLAVNRIEITDNNNDLVFEIVSDLFHPTSAYTLTKHSDYEISIIDAMLIMASNSSTKRDARQTNTD